MNTTQLYNDFLYLSNNVCYLYDEGDFTNVCFMKLLQGEMSRKDLLLWAIKDIYSNNYYCDYDKREIDWLINDKRSKRICERYQISISHLMSN